ncbi:AMP-binding protein [Larsenimonas suaedae]|uniref:AMP-binding protein n=1 Tax=Larsenimonas suaedae TaxID=1851019 RepID=A0ABU1GS04_9GAMM|nr:AMP-binding protein [Larsenimonas suaedae]MCM2972406.1 AMP-binding protein [Larsenimonas suaedae]MDR5894798.1 AMP-binding protein [Larsenimonas suaedae]
MRELLERMAFRAERAANGQSLVGRLDDGRTLTLTHRALYRAVDALSGQLMQAGARHVGLMGSNSPLWLIAQLAAWQAGLPVTPIPEFFSSEQIEHVLETTGLDTLIVTSSAGDGASMPAAFDHGTRLTATLAIPAVALTGSPPEVALYTRVSRVARLPKGTCLITFTSGTTGAPKGVCLSGAHLESVIDGLDARLDGLSLKRHGVVLPMSVLLEHLAGALYALWRGAEVILDAPAHTGLHGSGGVSVPQWRAWLETRRPDSLILVPGLLGALSALIAPEHGRPNWVASLSLVAVGGGYVPTALLARAVAQGVPVAQGYGLSELGSVVCLSRPDEPQDGRVGRPLDGLDVRLDDDGQLLIHGRRMLGYLGERDSRCDAAPWPSGDLGHLAPGGHWFLSGRQGNRLILSSARNLSPEWLEAELELLPGIQRAFVFGDGLPGPLALLRVVAMSAVTNDQEALDRAIVALNARLPDYARLCGWQVLDQGDPHGPPPLTAASRELTANGRLRRAHIRARRQGVINRLTHRSFSGSSGADAVSAPSCHAFSLTLDGDRFHD